MPILQLDGFTPTEPYHPVPKNYAEGLIVDFETTTQLNARDAADRARANHTGTQAAETITGLTAVIDTNTKVIGSVGVHSDVDVTTSTPVDGNILAWNNSNSAWEPNTVSGVSVTSVNGESGIVVLAANEIDASFTPSNYSRTAPDVEANLVGIDSAIGALGASSVTSVNTKSGTVVIDPDDLNDAATTHKFTNTAAINKLAGIEAGATASTGGFENVSSMSYNNLGLLTSFTADGDGYTITYNSDKTVNTIGDGSQTTTVSYAISGSISGIATS